MALATYLATFYNDLKIPIKVSYKTVQPGSNDITNITTMSIVVSPESQGNVRDLVATLPLRVLVQPQFTPYTNTRDGKPNYNWDSMNARTKKPDPDPTAPPVVADGAWIFVPTDVTTQAETVERNQGIFSLTYSVVGKPNGDARPIVVSPTPAQIRFGGQLLCGKWFNDCPGSLAGVQVDTCTGFQSITGQTVCQKWCDYETTDSNGAVTRPNAAMCDTLKEWVCTGQDRTDNYKKSPECVCISKAASQVRFPDLSDLTYTELIAALNKSPGWSLGGTPAECWFPGCTSPDALKTSTMQSIMAACPTPPTQICSVSVGQIVFDDSSSNNNVNLLNCCVQNSIALPPAPTPSPSSAPSSSAPSPSSSPSSSLSPSPTPGPAPAPAPASGLSQGAIIGIVVGALVFIIIVILVCVLGTRKRAASSPATIQNSAK
jgi:hypothetical protein